MWKNKYARIVKKTLKKKILREGWGLALSDVKIYYKDSIIKTLWYWCMNGQIDKWYRIKSPEMDPRTYGNWVYKLNKIEGEGSLNILSCQKW